MNHEILGFIVAVTRQCASRSATRSQQSKVVHMAAVVEERQKLGFRGSVSAFSNAGQRHPSDIEQFFSARGTGNLCDDRLFRSGNCLLRYHKFEVVESVATFQLRAFSFFLVAFEK
eukprot:TRINITY_DN43745_c0_g1_i1.p1 TRINITY_DN43745_c0_g1~~TRINITY_DN43745_c0_g1_i1.p1  ORF type:complete len:116 (-),score=9.41 TRINITY_DN43745_c0_g1_i1:16-363(-)